jgi:hypothetical protein
MATQIVGILSVSGATGAETYTIPTNPGNAFSISGSQLFAPSDLVNGTYSVTIAATPASTTLSLSLTYAGGFNPPPPPPPPLMATISVSPISVGIDQTSVVFFTWNDTVINFTVPAVAVTNGTVGTLAQIDATHFTAVFTPTQNIDGSATIQVQQSGTGGAVYSNSAGSVTQASNIATVAVDTVFIPPPPPPPLTSLISVFPASLGVGQTGTVDIVWNDTVVNFTLPAFAVTNGTLSSLVQINSTNFTATFTPTANFFGSASLQVQKSGTGGAVYSNSAGSITQASNIATVLVSTVITPPPPPPPLTSVISVLPTTLGTSQTSTVSITWNDVVINFTLAAFSVTNGTLSSLVEVNSTNYTAIFTPTPGVTASAILQVQQSGTGGAVYSNSAGSTTAASNIAAIVLTPFAAIRTLDNIPIGDSFAEITTDLTGTLIYSFTSNPGNLFSLNGNQIEVAGVLVAGTTYVIGVQVSNGVTTETGSIAAECIRVAASWIPGVRPWSATSLCNAPLASGHTYTPVAWPTSTGFNYFTGVKYFIDAPASDITTVCSWVSQGDFGGAPTQTINRVITPTFNGVALLLGNGDGDNQAVSMEGTNCLQMNNFIRTSDTTASSNLFGGSGASGDIINGTGFAIPGGGQFGNNLAAGVLASGVSPLMGCLLKEEFTRYGEFNHWIGFSMINSLTTAGFIAPAIFGDGGAGAGGLFKTGQLLAIPKTTAMPGGLSTYGQAMFRAMQNYGAWPFDTSGSVTPYMACVFDPIQSGASIPYAAATSWTATDKVNLINDSNILFPLLQIVS